MRQKLEAELNAFLHDRSIAGLKIFRDWILRRAGLEDKWQDYLPFFAREDNEELQLSLHALLPEKEKNQLLSFLGHQTDIDSQRSNPNLYMRLKLPPNTKDYRGHYIFLQNRDELYYVNQAGLILEKKLPSGMRSEYFSLEYEHLQRLRAMASKKRAILYNLSPEQVKAWIKAKLQYTLIPLNEPLVLRLFTDFKHDLEEKVPFSPEELNRYKLLSQESLEKHLINDIENLAQEITSQINHIAHPELAPLTDELKNLSKHANEYSKDKYYECSNYEHHARKLEKMFQRLEKAQDLLPKEETLTQLYRKLATKIRIFAETNQAQIRRLNHQCFEEIAQFFATLNISTEKTDIFEHMLLRFAGIQCLQNHSQYNLNAGKFRLNLHFTYNSYELALLSNLNYGIQPKRFYIQALEEGLSYKVSGPDNLIREGILAWNDLSGLVRDEKELVLLEPGDERVQTLLKLAGEKDSLDYSFNANPLDLEQFLQFFRSWGDCSTILTGKSQTDAKGKEIKYATSYEGIHIKKLEENQPCSFPIPNVIGYSFSLDMRLFRQLIWPKLQAYALKLARENPDELTDYRKASESKLKTMQILAKAFKPKVEQHELSKMRIEENSVEEKTQLKQEDKPIVRQSSTNSLLFFQAEEEVEAEVEGLRQEETVSLSEVG